MAEPITLESILASGTVRPFSGRIFRVMFNDIPPERENTRGARWNPPDIAAIYACFEPAVCIAEVEYGLSRQPLPVKSDLRSTLYEIDVGLAAVLDLRALMADLAGMGVELAHLHADDLKVSQEIGRLVTWLGHDGLLVPSARGGGANLVIYPGRSREDYRFEVVSSKPCKLRTE